MIEYSFNVFGKFLENSQPAAHAVYINVDFVEYFDRGKSVGY